MLTDNSNTLAARLRVLESFESRLLAPEPDFASKTVRVNLFERSVKEFFGRVFRGPNIIGGYRDDGVGEEPVREPR